MSSVIIDTNVAVVANRQNSDASEKCISACALFLMEVHSSHVILIDTGDEIRAEYAKALRMGRPMALGALFLVHVLRHQYDQRRVLRVDLAKGTDREFVDFPKVPELTRFDRDDRKFAALAKKTSVAVSNAVDSDWIDYIDILREHGIDVDFICGCRKDEWFS